MEDLGLAATGQGHLQGLQAELRVKAVGELPAEHMSGEQIDNGHQVQEALSQWDVGDIRRPGLIWSREQLELHKAWKAL